MTRAIARALFVWPAAEYALVLAPFWIGVLYVTGVCAFPDYRPFVFFIFLILLGESHTSQPLGSSFFRGEPTVGLVAAANARLYPRVATGDLCRNPNRRPLRQY